MGRSTQRRAWAATLNTDEIDVDSTRNETVKFQYNNCNWEYFVGLPEGDEDTSPHRHCGIRCLDRPVTKTAARNALAKAVGISEEALSCNYFKEIETTWSRYMAYAFKGKHTQIDAALKMAVKTLLNKGITPSKKTLMNALVEEHGYDNYNKKFKSVMDVALHSDNFVDSRGRMSDELDFEENRQFFLDSFVMFQVTLHKALEQNGFVSEWTGLKNCSLNEVAMLCEILALLPICTSRSFARPDKLPGLYLWGKSKCGKSAFFEHVYLKKFPVDSEGVSRFRMSAMQSGILFDDVGQDFWSKNSVLTTVKHMAVGYRSTVKTFGDTEVVCGYVVVTSNYTPFFLETKAPEGMNDEDWTNNADSMKRRFITIQYSEKVDYDPSSVLWDDNRIRGAAAAILHTIIRKLEETQPELVSTYLYRYKELVFEDYELGNPDACNWFTYHPPELKKMLKRLGGVDFVKPASKKPRLMVPRCACGNYADTCPDEVCREMWEDMRRCYEYQ